MNYHLKLIAFIAVLLFIYGCKKDVGDLSPFEGEVTKQKSLQEEAYPEEEGELRTFLHGKYERINGENVYQGDIILTDEQINGNESHRGTGLTSKRWPNGIVYFTINSGLANQARVTDAIAHWEANTSLTFVQRTSQKNFIEFVTATGCSSSLGMIGGRQTINLAPGCSTGNTIHEIGHAIGLMHEQTREDRDDFVEIHWENIPNANEHNFERAVDRGIDAFDHCGFDFGSIMMYGPFFFSSNGQPTITRLDGSLYAFQRNELSDVDVSTVQEMYQPYEAEALVAAGNKVYFTGEDKRIYNFYYSSNAGRWIATPLSWSVTNATTDLKAIDGSVFYRGTDNRLYRFFWQNAQWNHEVLSASVSNVKGGIAITQNGNKVYYCGTDGRVYNFYRTGSQWGHAPLSWSVTNATTDLAASETKVYYRGTDNRMHNFYFSNNTWQNAPLSWSVSNVGGEIQVDEPKVYYRGTDNRMHNFYFSNNTWQNAPLSWSVTNVSKDIAIAPGKVYYRGTDSRMHNFYWTGSWQNATLSWTVTSVAGDISAGEDTPVFYIDDEGKIRQFFWDGGQWGESTMCDVLH